MNWQALLAVATATVVLGTFVQWSVRAIIRQELEPVRRDIAVLRTAVFNHLRHGEPFTEQAIRERLGYE
ncbi:MAG: hypothetical protein ACRD0Y_12695 [Terriglobales bacterium]